MLITTNLAHVVGQWRQHISPLAAVPNRQSSVPSPAQPYIRRELPCEANDDGTRGARCQPVRRAVSRPTDHSERVSQQRMKEGTL